VWFPSSDASVAADGTVVAAKPDQVKDIRSGEQVEADPTTWAPPAEDLWPRVQAV
jgi:histidyl-tRNA synthetase